MKAGTKVSWKTKDGTPGHGYTLTDEVNGKVQVVVESLGWDEPVFELHYVLVCTVTWLTEIK